MKDQITIKNAVIVLAFLYAVTICERLLVDKHTDDSTIVQYEREKAQMQGEINQLESKISEYELKIQLNNARIDGLSDDQLDSTWATIFPDR